MKKFMEQLFEGDIGWLILGCVIAFLVLLVILK